MDTKYQSIGVITKVDGKATVKTADGQTHILKVGDIIHQHDKVMTDDNASVSLIMTDGKIIDIGADASKKFDADYKEKVPADVIQNAVEQHVSPEQISHAIDSNIPIANLLPMHVDHLYYTPWITLGKVESGFPTSHLTEKFIHHEEEVFGFPPENPKPPATPTTDLIAAKTDGELTAIPGTSTTYTIVISNNGPSAVMGAHVVDILPSGITADNWTAAQSGGATGFSASGSGNINDIVNLPVGASITYTVHANISQDATGTLTNSVTVTPPNGVIDINLSNNTDTDTNTLTPQVDLCVIKTDYKHSVVPGEDNTYTITVKNFGPSEIHSITLTDTIPAAFLDPNFTPSTGTYDPTTHIWSGLNLGSGDSIVMTLTGTIDPNATGILTNYVTVNPLDGVTDTNPNNNTAHDTDCLNPQVDLSIQKTDSVGGLFNPETNNTTGGTALNGSIITYTLTIHNSGPSNATNVVVTDTLPTGLVDINPGTGMISSGTITWNLGDIASGQTITLSFEGALDYSELPNATEVLFAGLTSNSSSSQVFDSWSNSAVTLYAFDFSTPFENSSHIIQLSNADQTVAYNTNGIGVTGTNNGQVPDQINHSSNNITNDSQALGVALNNSASTATIQINNLFLNENTGEYGKVTAFDATGNELNSFVFGNGSGTNGSAVASHFGSEFVAVDYFSGSNNQGSFTITSAMAGGDFSYLVFSGMPYGAGVISQQFPNNDSSDYFVQAINYTVPSQTGENIVNTVNVSSDTTDTNLNNNSNDTIQINHADLAITKTDGLTTAIPGQEDTYTITVTNNGAFDVNGAKVTDYFPSQYSASSWTATQTGGASGFTSVGSGDIVDTVNIPVGATITYTVHGSIAADATGNLVNFATVTPPSGVIDSNMGNNIATDTTPLTPKVDLSITKTDGKTSAIPGEADTYTIVVSNTGHSTATGVTVTDTFPAGFIVSSWTSVAAGGATGNDANGNGNINDTGISIPVGGSITYTVHGTVAANATGSLVNTATVVTPMGITDTNPGNNSATDTDTLTPKVDLGITKTDGQTSAIPGQADTYTIVVTNLGPSNATNATVTDSFPSGFIVSNWTSSATGGATGNDAAGNGNINDTGVNIPVGGSVTYTVHGTISAGATGTLSNTAIVTVGDNQTDSNMANNTATDTTTLTPKVDISVTKTDGKTIINQGAEDTYIITVSNTGPSNATGVTVTDNFPSGFIVSNWTSVAAGGTTGNDAAGNGNINDTGITIPVGGSITYTVHGTVAANAAGTLTNTASVTLPGGTTDSNTGNNSATDNTTINAVPTCNAAAAIVLEAALSTGTTPGNTGEVFNGSIPNYSFGSDGKAASTPFTWTAPAATFHSQGHDINPGNWVISNSGLTITGNDSVTNLPVITITMNNVNTGAFTVTLLDQLDHPLVNQVGVNDQISIPVGFTLKDSNGDTASNILNIAIHDDGPIANQATKSITEGNVKTNLMLTIDVSGSMDFDSGLTGLSRMDVQKAAAIELLDQYYNLGNNNDSNIAIRIITFSTNADPHGSTWETVASAKAFINSLSPTNSTNYDEALTDSMSAFANNTKVSGAQNIAYFFSDGEPNEPSNSAGINPAEQAVWEQFLRGNDINAFALGLGPNATLSALLPIAYNGVTETDSNGTNAMIVTNLADLSATLTGTISTLSGNIIGDLGVKYGADQPGSIFSVSSVGSTQVFDANTHIVKLTSANSGVLSLDLDDGTYTYNAPANLNSNISETFSITFKDFDGDSVMQNLIVNVTNADLAPIVRDDSVVTNISDNGAMIVIPDYALLFNDTDADGNTISISGVSGASSGSVSHASSVVTFTDNNTNGGEFDYTGTANGKSDTAHVTITKDTSGSLDDDGFGNILIAKNTATTMNGNEGNDVLIGGSANDTLNGGSGNDLLKGGLGNDKLTGGAGADTFLFAKADINISSSQTDTITDFTKSQGDVLNLSDLLTGGSPVLGSTPTAAQLDSYLTFSQSGSNTVLKIDSNGTTGSATVDHTITFQGTNLFTQFGSAATSHDLIANMQAANQIITHG